MAGADASGSRRVHERPPMSWPKFRDLAETDVDTFLAGLHEQKPLPITVRLSFPKTEQARDCLIKAVHGAYAILGFQRESQGTWEQRCQVIFKIAAHLTRTGAISTGDRVRAFHAVLQAAAFMTEHPLSISERVNVACLAARFVEAEQQRERLARQRRPADIPPRPIIYRMADGIHVLTELIHPWHLVDEGVAVGHCISKVMATPGNSPEDLLYWSFIVSGASRIFSLQVHETPVCTFHVRRADLRLMEVHSSVGKQVLKGMHREVLASTVAALSIHIPGLKPDIGLDPDVYRLVRECQHTLFHRLLRFLR